VDLKRDLDAVLVAPTREKRDLTTDEAALFDHLEAEIRALDDRIGELNEQATRDETAAASARRLGLGNPTDRNGASMTTTTRSGSWSVTREPQIYRRGGESSFFRDLFNARQKGDRDALDRLDRNNQVVFDSRPERRAISTTNSQGGEFVPPLWLEDQWIRLARPGRVTADRCQWQPLPPGTDSINIPKINTGTAVAVQTTQNTGVQQTDLTTTSVASPVVTIAGAQTVSLQLLEQSPLNIDEVVLSDLAADYAMKLDLQVLNGSGLNAQVTGLLTQSGTNAVTFTSATPSLGALYSKLAGAIQAIHTARFLPPTCIVMHPRRWAWCEAQLDSNNRPLIVPQAGGPFDVVANLDDQQAQGLVGQMLGLPVYTDANLPVNQGAGTNQDVILIMRAPDFWLWESTIRAEAFQQTYAQNMSVLVRLYNYVSFQPARYPASLSTVSGTGLVTPTF
jgi:HK97 family phage major capsid protein